MSTLQTLQEELTMIDPTDLDDDAPTGPVKLTEVPELDSLTWDDLPDLQDLDYRDDYWDSDNY